MIEENSGPAKSVPLSEVSHLVSVPLSEVLLYIIFPSGFIGMSNSVTYRSQLLQNFERASLLSEDIGNRIQFVSYDLQQ